MGNPILTRLAQGLGQNSQLSEIVALARNFRNAQNPQAFLENMMASNPRMKDAMDMIKQYDSPKDAYYALAKQKGVDPEEFLRNFR